MERKTDMKKLERARKKAIVQFLKLNPDEEFDNLLIRLDGRVEWICQHGVGHTIWEPWKDGKGLHGCDGCCKDIVMVK